jgi:hypothetical protein
MNTVANAALMSCATRKTRPFSTCPLQICPSPTTMRLKITARMDFRIGFSLGVGFSVDYV